jgi:hypothetical protein
MTPPIVIPDVVSIGCSEGSYMKTIVATGNFEGDGTRMSAVLDQSSNVMKAAYRRGNRVCYVIMGNIVPDVHHAQPNGEKGDDSLSMALSMARDGHSLGDDGENVKSEDVTLVIGPRELAWLRLANVSRDKREIVRFDHPDAMKILKRRTLLHERVDAETLPTWLSHNASLHLFEIPMTPNVIAVAMLLKLISVTQMTMNAPGVVRVFAHKIRNETRGDPVAYISLFEFLDSYNGSIEEGMERLVTKQNDVYDLTMEGLGLMPAAKDVVHSVLQFATESVGEYLEKGKFIHCFTNGDIEGGDGGLWVTSMGTDDGIVVGQIPVGIAKSGIAIEYKPTSLNKIEWSNNFNSTFRSFYMKFAAGDVDDALFNAYVAIASTAHNTTLPLRKLLSTSNASCSGICANKSTPFGTIQRRVLVDGKKTHGSESDLVRVLETWSGINTDAYTPSTYWTIATWCASTKSDILATPITSFNKSETMSTHLYNVSVTLASLLSTQVGSENTANITVGPDQRRSVRDFGFEFLNGLIGPVVSSSAHGGSNATRQPVRIVSFTHESIDSAFVLLIPEEFIQFSLDYANYDINRYTRDNEPFMVSEGFVALPDEAAIPLNLPGLSAAEVDGIRSDLGTRVWALPKKRSEKGIASFTTADYAAIAAMRKSDGRKRTLTIPGYKILHTQQGSADPFAGLNIGLALVPGKARMTLDADTSQYHSIFRVVGKS